MQSLSMSNVAQVLFWPVPYQWVHGLLLVLALLRKFFSRFSGFLPFTKTNICKFQCDQDRGPTWKPGKAHVAFSLDIVIYYECSSSAGVSSSCDSWAEQDIDDVENKSSKRTRKRRGSKQSKSKGKEQNFVKRNIEVEFIPLLCHFRNAFFIISRGECFLFAHSLSWKQ